MTGIALFAHGSRVEEANDAVRLAAQNLARRVPVELIEAAFLELGTPDLPDAIKGLIGRGAHRIVVIPYFLTLGTHLRRDLPRIVEEIRGIYPSVRIDVTEPLDGHPALLDVIEDRAMEALYGGSSSESQAG